MKEHHRPEWLPTAGARANFPLLYLLAGWCAVCCFLNPACANDGVAIISSHVVETKRRMLRNVPSKHVVLDQKGWERVVKGLPKVPSPPAFASGEVCLLVVTDIDGGDQSWIEGIKGNSAGNLSVLLYRKNGLRTTRSNHLKCFFYYLRDWGGGIDLEHRTFMGAGSSFIQRAFPTNKVADRDGSRLPRLGSDLRLSVQMAGQQELPKKVLLRHESYFKRDDLPARVDTIGFPENGLPYPRIRDGVTHVYAAHAPGYRTKNPLIIRQLPRSGRAGNPLPIVHRFLLEPVPQ